jgi:hypothetical protein
MNSNVLAKITKAAEPAAIAGGVITVIGMACASASPEFAGVANGISLAGATIAGTGLAVAMLNSLRLAD